jgi:hypothetical protein
MAVKIHGDLDHALQLLPPFRRGRSLDVATCRTRARRVRTARGLDEDVASRHAAFLHDMLNRKLRIAARVEFTNDRTFQERSPWLDESANNEPETAEFLSMANHQRRRSH